MRAGGLEVAPPLVAVTRNARDVPEIERDRGPNQMGKVRRIETVAEGLYPLRFGHAPQAIPGNDA